MNWFALLGILIGAYGLFAIYIALKKPDKVWKMGKVQGFVKRFGEKGTVVWFCIFGVILVGIGIWLVVL